MRVAEVYEGIRIPFQKYYYTALDIAYDTATFPQPLYILFMNVANPEFVTSGYEHA